MNRTIVVIAVVVAAVVATSVGGTSVSQSKPVADPLDTQAEKSTETTVPVGNVSESPDPLPGNNEWINDTVTVYVGGENVSRMQRELVLCELQYWETEHPDSKNLTFDIVQNESDADLRILYRENVSTGKGNNTIGLSMWRYDRKPGSDKWYLWKSKILIEEMPERSATRGLIRHEMGHVFGLTHNDTDKYEYMGRELDSIPV